MTRSCIFNRAESCHLLRLRTPRGDWSRRAAGRFSPSVDPELYSGLSSAGSEPFIVPASDPASSRHVKLAGMGRVGMTERGQALGYGRGYEPTCGRSGASWSVGPLSAGWAPKNGGPAVHPDGRHCGTSDPTSDCGPCGGHAAAGVSQAKVAALNAKGAGGTPAAGGWAGRAALAGHRRLLGWAGSASGGEALLGELLRSLLGELLLEALPVLAELSLLLRCSGRIRALFA